MDMHSIQRLSVTHHDGYQVFITITKCNPKLCHIMWQREMQDWKMPYQKCMQDRIMRGGLFSKTQKCAVHCCITFILSYAEVYYFVTAVVAHSTDTIINWSLSAAQFCTWFTVCNSSVIFCFNSVIEIVVHVKSQPLLGGLIIKKHPYTLDQDFLFALLILNRFIKYKSQIAIALC